MTPQPTQVQVVLAHVTLDPLHRTHVCMAMCDAPDAPDGHTRRRALCRGGTHESALVPP